jgi:hypothetical protein
MEANQLSKQLDSFLVARWGAEASERRRAEPLARPWGEGPAPEDLSDMMWAVFIDGREPHCVGIRAVEIRGTPMFLLIYWRCAGQIEAHHWRCDSAAGWQHVKEFPYPAKEPRNSFG